MAHEIEAAQVDALVSGRSRRRDVAHRAAPGSLCANCGAVLQGPWCHACGQLGEDFHRSAWKLLGESIEGIFHLDGRVWGTLLGLIWRPARLTRAYLDGHRAPQIPPLRLFLVVLLAVFLAGGLAASRSPIKINDLTPQQRAQIKAAAIAKATPAKVRVVAPGQSPTVVDVMGPAHSKANLKSFENEPLGKWLLTRGMYAREHPEELKLIMEEWAERFAFMMLPLAAALMSLLFIFQRRFFLFDHLIFTMHSLSFVGLMITASLLISPLSGFVAGLLYLTAPVHLFVHMRGVYGTSVFGTLLRMLLLFVGSVVGFALLMVGLVAVGLAGLNA